MKGIVLAHLNFHFESTNNIIYFKITQREKKGKSIWLISIGFPASSEYYGWYINVDRSKVYPVRNSPKQAKIFYPKDTMIPIYKYVKGSGGKKGYREQKELSADIVIEEFNSWRE